MFCVLLVRQYHQALLWDAVNFHSYPWRNRISGTGDDSAGLSSMKPSLSSGWHMEQDIYKMRYLRRCKCSCVKLRCSRATGEEQKNWWCRMCLDSCSCAMVINWRLVLTTSSSKKLIGGWEPFSMRVGLLENSVFATYSSAVIFMEDK